MSNVLLDTHAFYWWVSAPELIDKRAKGAITRAQRVLVSDASLWELVIKEATRYPIIGSDDVAGWFRDALRRTGFEPLAITREHIGAAQRLPVHHRDPFDRLLVAQAQLERCALVSRDQVLTAYDVPVIW